MTGDGADELHTVRLLSLPVDLHRQSSQHHAALEREFALLAAADPDGGSVPVRLRNLMDELSARFAGLGDAPEDRLQAAMAAGLPSVDLEYRVPAEAAEACRRLDALLDEADDFCRAGVHLLTLTSPPEVVRYRRWFLGEFVAQLAGGSPVPWRSPAVSGGTDGGSGDGDGGDGQGAARRLVLPAEVDLDAAPALRATLHDFVAGGTAQLLLDGGAVSFIDSVGVSVLMAAYARCEDAGGSLVIDPASDRLRTVLDSVGVADLLLRSSP